MRSVDETNRLHIAAVKFDDALKLADSASIAQDLGFVMDVLRRLHDLLEKEEPDGVAVQAYWTSALIVYVRCFASGKRSGLSESIFDGIEGGIETHRHFKAMRDKHIAHSVNPFEQVQVGVMLSPPSAEERKVEGISTFVMRHVSATQEGVEMLYQLAKIARKQVGDECESLQQATQAVAQTLNLDELYESAEIRAVAPGPEEASRPRG